MDSSQRPIDSFFYGLFMDAELLGSLGVHPANPRRAFVEGYELRIGERATLVPSADSRAYGMVFALTQDELDRLYDAPGLTQYQPEWLTVKEIQGEPFEAVCYVLPHAPHSLESNSDYAAQFRDVLTKLGFPNEYIESIS